mmetsp:Transcript_25854/g.61675  ORF Transcript_25854/g.61675 Transcript_25854/m.61675 type:complete len:254 (-) Transcript_25854:72-833(-)
MVQGRCVHATLQDLFHQLVALAKAIDVAKRVGVKQSLRAPLRPRLRAWVVLLLLFRSLRIRSMRIFALDFSDEKGAVLDLQVGEDAAQHTFHLDRGRSGNAISKELVLLAMREGCLAAAEVEIARGLDGESWANAGDGPLADGRIRLTGRLGLERTFGASRRHSAQGNQRVNAFHRRLSWHGARSSARHLHRAHGGLAAAPQILRLQLRELQVLRQRLRFQHQLLQPGGALLVAPNRHLPQSVFQAQQSQPWA